MVPKTSARVTAPRIRAMKHKGEKIVVITAYDAPSGALVDEAGVDAVLVGDSLGNVVLGLETTLPVTLEQMIHHTAATRRGVKRALLVADLPFGSYQSSVAQAVDSAIALVKAGAEAVKLEGTYTEEIEAIMKCGIPVMGHVGMTPQSIHNFGGFRVQGKGEDADAVLRAAQAVDEAGAFAIVLELIPGSLAKEITATVSCPTIGIGAGPFCDGQVQVFHDILGFSPVHLKHAKQYCAGKELFEKAVREYSGEVRSAAFPSSEHTI
jgi:3-methyl-2-oxobutanoate hydroxymethyltransferase